MSGKASGGSARSCLASEFEQEAPSSEGTEQSCTGSCRRLSLWTKVDRRRHSCQHQGMDWIARSPDGEGRDVHGGPRVRSPLWKGRGGARPPLWEGPGGGSQRALWLCHRRVRGEAANTKSKEVPIGGEDADLGGKPGCYKGMFREEAEQSHCHQRKQRRKQPQRHLLWGEWIPPPSKRPFRPEYQWSTSNKCPRF